MTDIVERLIAYRHRQGRSREGRELLADACNTIMHLRGACRDAHSRLVADRPSEAKEIVAKAMDYDRD